MIDFIVEYIFVKMIVDKDCPFCHSIECALYKENYFGFYFLRCSNCKAQSPQFESENANWRQHDGN